MAETSTTSNSTVKFNVGGRYFEVSRSLIETHFSDTMLGRLISKTWYHHHGQHPSPNTSSKKATQNKDGGSCSSTNDGGKQEVDEHHRQHKSGDNGDNDNDNDNKKEVLQEDTSTRITPSSTAIFIDRDGELFSHVLHFMRNGGNWLTLPTTMSRELLLNELEYYCIPYSKETITYDVPSPPYGRIENIDQQTTNDANGDWHKGDEDMPFRRKIIKELIRMFDKQKENSNFFPMMKHFELNLYKSASSLEVYSNVSTLRQRLEHFFIEELVSSDLRPSKRSKHTTTT